MNKKGKSLLITVHVSANFHLHEKYLSVYILQWYLKCIVVEIVIQQEQ